MKRRKAKNRGEELLAEARAAAVPVDEAMKEMKEKSEESVPESYLTVLEEMKSMYLRKNHDYGNSFDLSLDKHGVVAGVVRLGDKMNRLDSIVDRLSEARVDESFYNTLLDLANYAVMTLSWLIGGRWKNVGGGK